MADVSIKFIFSDSANSQSSKPSTSAEVILRQSGEILSKGKISQLFDVKSLDLLEECELEIQDSDKISQICISLIPLLTINDFSINLWLDCNFQYFSHEVEASTKVQLQIQRLGELSPMQVHSRVCKKVKPEEMIGLEKEFVQNSQKYMHDLALALNSKLIQEEAKQIVRVNLEEVARDWDDEKRKLLENFGSSVDSFKIKAESHKNIIFTLQEQVQNLMRQVQDKNSIISQRDSAIQELDKKIIDLEKQILTQSASIQSLSQLSQENEILRQEIISGESQRQSLRSELDSSLSNYSSLSQSFQNFISSSPNPPETQSSQESLNESNSLLSKISSLETELARLQTELESAKSEIKIAQLTQSQFNSEGSSFDPESTSSILQNRIKITSQASELNSLLSKLRETQKKLEETEENLQHQEAIIKLISINSKVSSTNQKIEQKPDFSFDLARVTEELSRIQQVSTDFERNFYTQCSAYFSKINLLSSLNLNMHRLISKFVKVIQDKDCQIYMLRHIARDAALERKVYVPVKTDPIDLCLADYIHNRKAPLQIPLIREDSGVYNFYTRTIKLKIENNKVIVRLGGGFEGIDEFLNSNTQAELDKLDERRKFFCAESVKKFIDFDFQILGLPSVIDFFTPVTPLPEAGGSNLAGSQQPSSPKNKKRPSILIKEASAKVLMKKRTMG